MNYHVTGPWTIAAPGHVYALAAGDIVTELGRTPGWVWLAIDSLAFTAWVEDDDFAAHTEITP